MCYFIIVLVSLAWIKTLDDRRNVHQCNVCFENEGGLSGRKKARHDLKAANCFGLARLMQSFLATWFFTTKLYLLTFINQMSLWKNTQNVSKSIFLSKSWIKVSQKCGVCMYFCNYQVTGQSKQSPIGRNFAQSGHLDLHSLIVADLTIPHRTRLASRNLEFCKNSFDDAIWFWLLSDARFFSARSLFNGIKTRLVERFQLRVARWLIFKPKIQLG
jgi:hypothetical protein